MKPFYFILFLLSFPQFSQSQSTRYEVSFPNAVHHEAQITATFSGLSNQPLRVRMSRSSPGRYATHEFAKNLYSLKATDEQGKSLEIMRVDPDTWEVSRHGAIVQVTYTLFGNWVDGTYAAIDPIHAHLNMPATFLWAKGLENAPITVQFNLPAGSNWKVATQLKPTSEPNVFTAPDLPYFMDSPTELSNFSLREWTETNTDNKPATFRLALHHDGTDADVDEYAPMVKKIVQEAKNVYGEWPSFDFGTYTFIQDVLPGNDGDGMEHRNSTFITDDASIKQNKTPLLGTVSHEFFHSWNVERIRPKALEPFNFERPNMSGELWFAEGFTSYYGELILARAGFYNAQQYGESIGRQLNFVLNSPGARSFSPVEMSQQAPFTDAATAIDPTNFVNTFTSYYPYGCVVGLALDLSLRSQFKGLTLDKYMQAVWQAYGKPQKPYTVADLQQTLSQVTKDSAFANDFFRRYVTGHERPDYLALLAKAGFLLRQAHPEEPYLGTNLAFEGDKIILKTPSLIGSSLYQAGLDQGDVLVTLDNVNLQSPEDVRSIFGKHKPGDQVPLTYWHRGKNQTTTITFAPNPQLEVIPYEHANKPLSKEVKEFRANWLGRPQKP